MTGRRRGGAARAAPSSGAGRQEACGPARTGCLGSAAAGAAASIPGRPPRDLAGLFSDASRLWLEIGFGGGEHLAAQARANPRRRLHRLRAVRERHGEASGRRRRGGLDEHPPLGRGRDLLLPPCRRRRCRASTCSIPIPGRSAGSASAASSRTRPRELARVMRPGAELRFATDIDDYAGWVLARLLRSPDFRWTADAPTTGASPTGLAGHPLRGQGAPGRPRAELSDLRARSSACSRKPRASATCAMAKASHHAPFSALRLHHGSSRLCPSALVAVLSC